MFVRLQRDRLALLLAVVLVTLTAVGLQHLQPLQALPPAAAQTNPPPYTPPTINGVFYQYQVLHRSDADTPGSAEYVSINDKGMVAWNEHYSILADRLLASDGTATAVEVATAPPSGDFDGLQINNANKIVAIDNEKRIGGVDFWRVLQFEARAPFTRNIVAVGTADSDVTANFHLIHDQPGINNNGLIAFTATAGRDSRSACRTQAADERCLVVPNPLSQGDPSLNPFVEQVVVAPSIPEPRIADTGQVLVWEEGTGLNGDPEHVLSLYGFAAAMNDVIIADGRNFSHIGRQPAISDDGRVIVFYGDLKADAELLNACSTSDPSLDCPDMTRTSGPGIFASVLDRNDTWRLIRLTGRRVRVKRGRIVPAPELGYNEQGQAITLDPTAFDPDAPLSVTSMVEESFVVAFTGTPTEASRTVTPAQGRPEPLLFDRQAGLWTMRVDRVYELTKDSPNGQDWMTWRYIMTSPRPVIQRGDQLHTAAGALQVDGFGMYDALATVATGPTGQPRARQRRGDHQIAFWIRSGADYAVLRGTNIDTDQDGLLDHWELAGIDMDWDGTSELDLAALGSDPTRRDLFLEVDWLARQRTNNQTRDFSPAQGALTFLVDMFAAAPEPIVLHIDAGVGRSHNMPNNRRLLDGGDRVSSNRNHIDIIHFGLPGSVREPGRTALSFDAIKQEFFGKRERSAREFVFRYIVLGDIAEGSAAQSAGASEFVLRQEGPVYAMPGNDMMIGLRGARSINDRAKSRYSFPAGFLHGQVIAHELGHTLGLRHGGTDDQTSRFPPGHRKHKPLQYKPNYLSLINYTYGTGLKSDFPADWARSAPPDTVRAPGNYFVNAAGELAILNGQTVRIVKGQGAGQELTIRSNSPNEIFLNGEWNPVPDENSRFAVIVRDYSRAGDAVYADWDNVQFDFYNYFEVLGNSFKFNEREPGAATSLQGARLAQDTPPDDDETEGRRFEDVVDQLGPLDMFLPTASISAPAEGSALGLGSTLVVRATASDDIGVNTVGIAFDTNGDGSFAASEMLTAQEVATDTFTASFANISGPVGTRVVSVTVTDFATRITTTTHTITLNTDAPLTPTATPTPTGEPSATATPTPTPTPTQRPGTGGDPNLVYLPLLLGRGNLQ